MKTKKIVQNKIYDLEAEFSEMEIEIKGILADQINTNYIRVSQLCDGINITLNEIETLKGCIH